MLQNNFKLILSCLFVFCLLLFPSCKKNSGDMHPEMDFSYAFELGGKGDCALIAHDNRYLFLRLKSCDPETSTEVEWWYQKSEDEVFDFYQAESGVTDLYEKYKVFRKENGNEHVKDIGSQLFIQVNDMLVEWSAGGFFYLPGNYRYKLFDQTKKNERISLTNIKWEKGNLVKE